SDRRRERAVQLRHVSGNLLAGRLRARPTGPSEGCDDHMVGGKDGHPLTSRDGQLAPGGLDDDRSRTTATVTRRSRLLHLLASVVAAGLFAVVLLRPISGPSGPSAANNPVN